MSSSGNHTKELITDVSSKLRLPKDRSTDISYIRALLGNTILKDTMHSHRLAESPECDCSFSRETLDHFICWCPLFANQRQTLYAEYQGIFPERLHTPMSLQSLLGHQWDTNITLREEELIKDALFKFLLHTGKLL